MFVAIEKFSPVVLIFLFGYFLKKTGILTKEDGNSFLKVFFNVSFPAIILLSVAQMNFSLELLWLPVIAVFIVLTTFIVAHCCGKLLSLDKPSFGTFMVSSLIMNTGFIIPFLMEAKGADSLALASLFDFGNTALVFTFTYYLACRYGGNSNDSIVMVKKFICSPPLLALIVGLFLNFCHFAIPNVVDQFLKKIGYMTGPLMMLSLGIYFSPKVFNIRPVFFAVFIRMGVGLTLGVFFAHVFNLKGLSKAIVLVISSAPTGISTLVFSHLEELNDDMAASIVSYSVLAGMFLVPIVLQMVG